MATLTSPSGRAGTPITPARLAQALGWSLERLDTALAALDDQLADTGVRIDHDPAPTHPPPLRGLRPATGTSPTSSAPRCTSSMGPTLPLDVETARVLDAIARALCTLTERTRTLDPAAVVALQQRGLIRRHHRGGYLELTDDARYGFGPHRSAGRP